MLLAIISLLLSTLGPARVAAQDEAASTASDWAAPRTVYIPETGQTLDQLFLDLWRNAGGASSYGYPITPELTLDNGHIVQYLQYARLEYWPEGDENGNTVILGKIGEDLRPISLPRSVASFTSAGARQNSSAAIEAAQFAQAWLPVSKSSVSAEDSAGRYIEETEHTVRGSFLDLWERTGEAAYLGNPFTEAYTQDDVTYQVFKRGQVALEQGGEPYLMPVGQVLADKYRLDQAPVAQGTIPSYSEELFIPPPEPEIEVVDAGPGPVPGASKSLVVSISQQRVWAYENETVVLTSLVSTGKPGFDTPTGMFSISKKVELQDMEGLIGGEYYNVTDVPDVMYFTAVGHAFHGTYWHDNFGAVMSHGCVNLPIDVAQFLYEWTPMETPVLILP